MKIVRTVSQNKESCAMEVRGAFGNVHGFVRYSTLGPMSPNSKPGYIFVASYWNEFRTVGYATDFDVACRMLLEELKIIKTIIV